MLFKRESKVQKRIKEHAEKVMEGIEELKEAVFAYLDSDLAIFSEKALRIREIETQADEIKREAETQLYKGAYLPLLRVDFLALMELVDDVVDEAESIADFLLMEKPSIPERWHEAFRKITERTYESYFNFKQSYFLLYKDIDEAFALARQVKIDEKEIDKLQGELITEIFGSDMDLAHKIHLRDLVLKLGQVSNAAENASDKVRSIALVRKI